MKLKKHYIAILITILFLIISCKEKSSAKEEIKPLSLVIGFIPHVQFTPLYVGQEKGFFEEEGIELKIEYGFGVDAFSLILNNKIDFTLSDADQLILAGEKKMGLKSFYQYYQDYPVTIIANEGFSEPHHLKGKTLGVPDFFGSSYIGAQLFLKNYQLEDQLELVKIGYTQISSLAAKKVDSAVCFYNNEPIQLTRQGVKYHEWKVRDFSNIVGASFISSSALLSEKKDLFDGFKRAMKKSTAFTIDHPDEALEIAYNQIDQLKEEDRDFWLKVLLKTCDLFQTEGAYGSLDKNRYTMTIETLKKLGLISSSYPVEDILE